MVFSNYELNSQLLGETIREIMFNQYPESGFAHTRKFWAEQFYEVLGFSITSYFDKNYTEPSILHTEEWLTHIEEGNIYGTDSKSPSYPLYQLDILSRFLFCIGIEEESRLISKLEEITYFYFNYPPEEEIKSNILEKFSELPPKNKVKLNREESIMVITEREFYQDTLENHKKTRSDLLGKTVNRIRHNNSHPINFWAEQFYELLELNKPGIAGQWIRYIEEGVIYGTYSDNPHNPKGKMRRLSILLYCIGIEEESELVNELEDITPLFQYPPDDETIEKIVERLDKRPSIPKEPSTRFSLDARKVLPREYRKSLKIDGSKMTKEYHFLRQTVKKIMSSNYFRISSSQITMFWAEQFHEILGYAQSTAQSWLSTVEEGRLYGVCGNRMSHHKLFLDRLSIFLYCMGIEEEHDLINGIKEINSLFHYPPDNETIEKINERFQQLPPVYVGPSKNSAKNDLKKLINNIPNEKYPEVRKVLLGYVE